MELAFGSTRPDEPSEITIGAPTHPLQKPGRLVLERLQLGDLVQ